MTVTITTPATIRALLKQFSYGNVRYSDGTVFRRQGSMVKAIPTGAGVGPLTVTSAAEDRAKAKLQEVLEKVRELPGCSQGMSSSSGFASYIFNEGTKKEFQVTFNLTPFPAYPVSERLDPAYQDFWITVSF